MSKVVTARVDEKTKSEADLLFDKLGINTSTFIKMALKQAVRTQSIPFKVEDNNRGRELDDYNLDELFKKEASTIKALVDK